MRLLVGDFVKKSRVDEVYAKTWLLLYTRNVPVQSWLRRYHVYAHACTPVRNGGVARMQCARV